MSCSDAVNLMDKPDLPGAQLQQRLMPITDFPGLGTVSLKGTVVVIKNFGQPDVAFCRDRSCLAERRTAEVFNNSPATGPASVE